MRFEFPLHALQGLPRIAVVITLFTLALTLSIETHLYATAVVAVIAGMLLMAGGTRASGAERSLERTALESTAQSDYLQSMLDTVNAALIVLDEDGRVALVNRAAQRLAGTPVHQLAQVPLIGASTAARIQGIPPGQSDVVELLDGQAVLATVSQFHAEGQSRRLIALQRIASDLERVQLRAWRDVMSTLSHEMMNSLTPIASLAETLHGRMQRMPVDSELAGIEAPAIEAIARRSRGLLEFVQRYREVAELPEPRIEAIDASEFALRLERLIAPVAAKRNILFECRLDATAQRLVLDPVLAEQAVVNLLFNALDAAEGVPGAMAVLHARVTQNELQLAVIDNGTGVDPSNRTQLFVPFFTTKSQGSGIGLNLARNIALVHGGRLTYEPNVPQGSVFTLGFPKSD